jgi:hypothetical protein
MVKSIYFRPALHQKARFPAQKRKKMRKGAVQRNPLNMLRPRLLTSGAVLRRGASIGVPIKSTAYSH